MIHAQYIDPDNKTIKVTLEAGDALFPYYGPIELSVPVSPGNMAYDSLVAANIPVQSCPQFIIDAFRRAP
jgi:hypothetical protein